MEREMSLGLPEVRLAELEQFLDDVASLVAWFEFWERFYNSRASFWSGVLDRARASGLEESRILALERRVRDFRHWSVACGHVVTVVAPCVDAVEGLHEKGMGVTSARDRGLGVTTAEKKALTGV